MSTWKERLEELRKNPETCMSGTRWTPEEDARLHEEITDQGRSFEDIALAHQRTVGGIQSHLSDWAVECVLKEEGCTCEEASRRFRVPVEVIEKKRQKRTGESKRVHQQQKLEQKDGRVDPSFKTSRADGIGGVRSQETLSRIESKLDALLYRLAVPPFSSEHADADAQASQMQE